ncbi:MAG: hypothetical protein PF508_00465, partial [Spirochaeta sp.]|nr:hypothetical protein [Spirochaeta sp.]
MVNRGAVLATILITISALLPAQNFRGEVVARNVPSPHETVTETLSGGQVLILTLAQDRIFTSGLDVRIRPAEGETPVPGAFTAAVYAAVDAPAEEGVVNIAGSLQERLPLGNA